MEKLDRLAKEMFAEFGFWTCSRVEQEDILHTVKNDLLWNIEQFHLGAISAFECIEQIKEKIKEL
tara:strand:- start:1599 stop:1793 length:195 start_codon:yes stop_codon:yes gene_type:complete